MNRNKTALTSRAHICSAVVTLFEITKLLRLHREKFEAMFAEDVAANINHTQYPGFLPYAEGLRDAYITAIIKDHCEFVYFDGGVRYSLDEARRKGPGELGSAVCGYQWLDSESDFTTFQKEIDLWI